MQIIIYRMYKHRSSYIAQGLIITILWSNIGDGNGTPLQYTLAWKIPRMEEPGRLRSMGSLRVRHDRATSLSLFTFMHWKRKWQPIPVLLPGESQGRVILVGCRLWGRTESDTTEVTQQVLSVVFNRPCKMLMSFFIFCLHYGRCWRWATGESETQAWATSAPATNLTLRNIEKPAKIS